MTYPVVFFWLLLLWGLFASPSIGVKLFFAAMPFGSISLISPEFVGGVTVLPSSIFAAALILKVLAPSIVRLSPQLRAALALDQLGMLVLFLVVAIFATVFIPRLYAGEVVIVPMRPGRFLATELLAPIQANFTQAAYLTLSCGTVLAVALLAMGTEFPRQVLSAMLIGGAVAVGTGIVDVTATAMGGQSLLEPYRNATYGIITNDEVQGLRRVIGLMPEASSYGALCVALASALVFLRPLYAPGRARRLATIIALVLIGMAMLSTSSTSYVGVAVLAATYFAYSVFRPFQRSGVVAGILVWEFLAAFSAVIVALALFIFRPETFTPVLDLVGELIFNKANTSSYFERMTWSSVSWDAVWATSGLGVGLGSTRTSNWFISIISNTGVLGAALLGIFMVQTFARRASRARPELGEMLTALKLSLIPFFVMASLAGTSPDFGTRTAFLLGTITGLAGPWPRGFEVRNRRGLAAGASHRRSGRFSAS